MRRGFSLIEILVVIAIIVMAVGLIAVNTRGLLSEEELRSAFDALALEYDAARIEAQILGEELLLRIDPEHNRIVLERLPQVDVQDYMLGLREARRRQVTEKPGEEIRRYDFDEHVVDLRAVYVNGQAHYQQAVVFFGPDGQGETHRILLMLPGVDDESLAFEYRGYLGKLREIEPERFAFEAPEETERIESLIEDDDMFVARPRPAKPPDPDGGPEDF